MKRKVNKYELDHEKTCAYFVDHIQCEKKLSTKIVEVVNFSQGKFFTLLPNDANVENIYEFDQSIIPAIPYGTQTYEIPNRTEKFHPNQVITTDRECSEFILYYLKLRKNHFAVVENYNLTPKNSHAFIKKVEIATVNDEVYYVLVSSNTVDEIYETLRKSNAEWHFLTILTKLNYAPLNLTDDLILQICTNAQFIITSAYDGEGYIYWESNQTRTLNGY